MKENWRSTTILSVRKGGQVVVAGDGQVTAGATIMKANAKKVRRLSKSDVIVGFAGATADAFALSERLEAKIEQHPGNLTRACVELAKDWRMDKYLRQLQAMMAVVDAKTSLILSGTGDVVEPEFGLIGVGSGGPFAVAAARALLDMDLSAEEIARRAMKIAADICIYTNENVTIEFCGPIDTRPTDMYIPNDGCTSMTTALHINNSKASRLARKLAKQTGETITDAIIHALEERLERNASRQNSDREARKAAILEILREMDKLPVLDPRSPDEILGYDENGLPT